MRILVRGEQLGVEGVKVIIGLKVEDPQNDTEL
jgi:hypothetical protein